MAAETQPNDIANAAQEEAEDFDVTIANEENQLGYY